MSYYTDTILYVGCVGEEERQQLTDRINRFFWDDEFEEYSQIGFVVPGEIRGLWIGSLRNIDVEALVEYLKNMDWGELKSPVQLMVKGEDDDRFKIIDVRR
jgi:hypothetical protein